MGYRTQYSGELTITPPLTESEHDRLLALCKLDNPRAKDVFAGITAPTPDDRDMLDSLIKLAPWELLFYGWYIGPGDGINSWVMRPPDSEVSGYTPDESEALTFLHNWLKANGHGLSGEVGWSGSGDGDTGTIWVDAVHGVEAVEDIHDNPGPSWLQNAAKADRKFYTLAEIRNGTGWPEGARFALLTPEEIGKDWAREQLAKQEVYAEPDGRKLYVIEFLYADNNQLFQTFAHLTEPESQQVQGYLERLKEYGEIEGLGDQGSGDFVGEWSIKPHPSMAELVKEFANNDSFAGAREDGITLEVASAETKG